VKASTHKHANYERDLINSALVRLADSSQIFPEVAEVPKGVVPFDAQSAAIASISIKNSEPKSLDTSTNVTAGAAGGEVVAKNRFRASR
jgi:hypothetical protein